MKARELVYLLGLRPKPRQYGFEIRTFDLPSDGTIEYAQWKHPRETQKKVTQESVDALRSFLRPGDLALDIGAHTGDSSIPMALAVGPSGCVLALEPNRYVFPVLEKNASLNQTKTNIIPLSFAATDVDGDFEFEYSDAGFCNGGRHDGIRRWRHAHTFRLPVEGRNLERYLRVEHPDFLERLRYIKVDAEGDDLAVLRSLESLIAEVRPFIKAEVFRHLEPKRRAALFQFFSDRGYLIHRVEDEENYRGAILGARDISAKDHFDVFCSPVMDD